VNRAFVHFLRAIVRPICWTWFRSRQHGAELMPREGPLLVAANHASFIDPAFAGAFSPRLLHYIARSSLGNRLGRALLHSMGTRFVDREGSARAGVETGLGILAARGVLLLFPEGTRTRDGAIGPFKRGVELMCKLSGAPVMPLGIRGAYRALPRGAIFPRPHKLELCWGAPIPAAEILAPGGLERLRRTVAELAGAGLSDGAEAAAERPHNPIARTSAREPLAGRRVDRPVDPRVDPEVAGTETRRVDRPDGPAGAPTLESTVPVLLSPSPV
jgi:1-acyl-sn-glycerol-3-phosphate acyltransferase